MAAMTCYGLNLRKRLAACFLPSVEHGIPRAAMMIAGEAWIRRGVETQRWFTDGYIGGSFF